MVLFTKKIYFIDLNKTVILVESATASSILSIYSEVADYNQRVVIK